MSTEYYSKELPESPIYINGAAVRFDLLETQDPSLIQHLNNAAAKHVGGIVKLTQQQYEAALELKKKAQLNPSLPKRHQREEVRQKVVPLNRRKNAAAVVADIENSPTPEQAALQAQNIEKFRPKTAKGILS